MAQINTNLLGTLRTTRAFIPALRERGGGTIITTTSLGVDKFRKAMAESFFR